VREAFGPLGEVQTLPGRDMDAAAVRDADLLLVRSITKVGKPLLEGSVVQFVGTATIGEDHIDRSYLAARRIGFASAPGSNANSVAEYVLAALLEVAEHLGLDLRQTSLGVVGVGNVGKRVRAKAEALGMQIVLNDPPLARTTGDPVYRPLGDALACDIVTLHVPLSFKGQDATFHLAGESFFERMKGGAVLVNSSRGPVVDEMALKQALSCGRLQACVLDVWENEPEVDVELLEQTFLGTPHIAGYSFDGKVNGTLQVYEAACHFLGIAPSWDPATTLPAPDHGEIAINDSPDPLAALREAVRMVYDVRRDDRALRRLSDMSARERPAYFDRLRRDYPRRREFHNTRVILPEDKKGWGPLFSGAGFQLG
jgi:erythronate-4-phosphate dehydrogenase